MNPLRHSTENKMGAAKMRILHQYPHIYKIILRTQTVAIVFLCASLLFILGLCVSGCGNKFFDPTDVGRFRPVPVVNVILDSLSVAEEAPSAWAEAEDPKPIDVMAFETDYAFSSGDVVRISIFELLQEGTVFTNDYVVTETGKISIPEVGVIEAGGFTETQLEEEIRQVLEPSILKGASVTVTLMRSQTRTFSISGEGVPAPGRYEIPRYDFRLLHALATAGGISQFNISYVYVSRSVTGKESIAEPIKPGLIEPGRPMQLFEPEQQMMETIVPSVKRQLSPRKQELLITAAELTTVNELDKVAFPDGLGKRGQVYAKEDILDIATKLASRETIEKPTSEDEVGRIEWIFRDGGWIPVRVGRPEPTEPVIKVEPEKPSGPLEEKAPLGFDWSEIGTAGVQTRVIKIPADRLSAGNPRYNIVIRPGDTIHVPVDIMGEFCIMGNVNLQGFIIMTGRPMTLKMAIAAAGGLGPLAWPKRCEVVRRIGSNKEEIVMVDLDKIASGEQPDFFIKPNDLINVGTHSTARWRAVLRNAFRATYGFGFIYDRNFADRDFGTHRPIPDWF
ncbi:MAG: polysaccharide biosynthesis/export family protein [Planctomycetota bacterium]|jgi:polysaccharide export outer membrane protein